MRTLGPLFLASALVLTLSGCGAGLSWTDSSAVSAHTTGSVHGGQQPVVGSQVYMYSVATTNGGTAVSRLNAPGFVLTDLNGNFSITGAYTCPAGSYVYLLAVGGNPGLGTGVNTKIALAAGLGPCYTLNSSTFIAINEVTTVAFAAGVASIATSSTQIGSSSNLTYPFAYASTLAKQSTGQAIASHDGLVLPQTTVNTLANAIAACVNSDGNGAACTTLFSATSASPADTFQAALNIAKSPSTNVGAIYNLSTPNAVFQPTLPSAPASWALPVSTSNGAQVPDANTYAFTTPVGVMCVQLRPDVAPLTVANFRYYVNNGSYAPANGASMFIHRSVPNFVIQGGGYKYDGNNTTLTPTTAPVANEFNLSNVRGTIAMAKLTTDPNSATDQWFFNTVNNSTTLDTQNGGSTVFGSIVGVAGYSSGGCATTAAGLAVMDAVNALSIYNAGSPFDQLPVINYTSGPLALSNLVTTAVTQATPQ